MNRSHLEIIRRHSRPLEPTPTGEEPRLCKLSGIRAVLFDIYGTMLISASGDVGTSSDTGLADAFQSAMRDCGVTTQLDGAAGVELLQATIRRHHDASRTQGIQHPEVQIDAVWRDVVDVLKVKCASIATNIEPDAFELALRYEVRANPVWPMPKLREVIHRLHDRRTTLGVVSNAQFFTPLLFPALVGESLEEMNFATELQIYSYRYGRAKPDPFLYRQAEQFLASRGVAVDEALYIGNDMLNDVTPAARVGFRTGLFAGDARSLRLRNGDARVEGVKPDIVLTELAQIDDCLD